MTRAGCLFAVLICLGTMSSAWAGDTFSYYYQDFAKPSPRQRPSLPESDSDEDKPKRHFVTNPRQTETYQDRVVGNNVPKPSERNEPEAGEDLPYGFSSNANSYAFSDRNF